MFRTKTISSLLVLFICIDSLSAQLYGTSEPSDYNADHIRSEIEKGPYFTLYKDNYFIGGIPLGDKPDRYNTDIKFQLSISQRLTKSSLPFNTYLYLQYTQKAFWNILENSLPIRDINFNPGIGLGHLIVYRNRYIGKGYLMLEHESNGKVAGYSRSWNKVTLGGNIELNRNFEVQLKGWIPIIDGRNNKDILNYNGIFQVAGNFRTNNELLHIGLILTKRKSWRPSFNTQVEISYKLKKNHSQAFFMQYYNGYGENLLEYKEYHSNIRVGFVIKPPQGFSFY